MDTGFPGFFGMCTKDHGFADDWAMEFGRNQAFAKKDFPRLLKALVEAQKRDGPTNGTGIIATLELTTVDNPW